MAKTIIFVTGNVKKLAEVKAILGDGFPFKLENRSIDLPEYQGEADDICKAKCEAAFKIIGSPVIIEDTCLNYNAFGGGLPGPYIKWFEEKLGPDGLYKLLAAWEDKSATAICTIGYTDGNDVQLFKGIVEGDMVEPRGPRNFGFDPCFQPKGYNKTFAELGPEVKQLISHRYLAVKSFQEFIGRQ